MEKVIVENHKTYLQRKSLYRSFGYDVDKERNFIIKQAGPFSGKILEAGTGKGHFTLALAKKGYRFTTFDISKVEQSFAKLNLKYFGLNRQVKFHIENGEKLNFKDKSFDVIFSVNTLHHLANPYKVINELIRILSSCGKIILSDFTRHGFKMMDKIHEYEGKTHEVSKVKLSDISRHLLNKGFRIQKNKSKFQEILIAYHVAI